MENERRGHVHEEGAGKQLKVKLKLKTAVLFKSTGINYRRNRRKIPKHVRVPVGMIQ